MCTRAEEYLANAYFVQVVSLLRGSLVLASSAYPMHSGFLYCCSTVFVRKARTLRGTCWDCSACVVVSRYGVQWVYALTEVCTGRFNWRPRPGPSRMPDVSAHAGRGPGPWVAFDCPISREKKRGRVFFGPGAKGHDGFFSPYLFLSVSVSHLEGAL